MRPIKSHKIRLKHKRNEIIKNASVANSFIFREMF